MPRSRATLAAQDEVRPQLARLLAAEGFEPG
jgi:hypothetical protein